VSTDDDEIASVARHWGADVPFIRPAELAQDDTTHIAVVEHVIDRLTRSGKAPDYVMVLQPTSPLRTSEDIDAAIALVDQQRCEAVVSVAPAHPHPWLTKRIVEDGTIGPFMGISTSDRRQDLPTPYVLNGAIYLITPDALRRYGTFSPDGAVAYLMPPERSLDIDSAYELRFADMLLRKDPDAAV